ncbi:MAG: NUDIX hydrolase [Actinomycetota bacterium]
MLRNMFCADCGHRLDELPPTRCRACGEHHWNNPKPCGSAIVERDGRALLIKRARAPWRGHWDIPGGFCDPAEHPEDAARREVTEETGLRDIELTGCLGAWIDTYPDERAERGERPIESTLNVCYLARSSGDGRPQPDPGEVLEARYFAADELPAEIAFPDHILPALAAWSQRQRQR